MIGSDCEERERERVRDSERNNDENEMNDNFDREKKRLPYVYEKF